MIDFQKLDLTKKAEYDRFLLTNPDKGCEYSFANLYMWGRQEACLWKNSLLLFSQFHRRSAYPFPLMGDDPKEVLDAILADAMERGVHCRFTSMSKADCDLLEQLYPGKFRFYDDRDGYDYVYNIDDLADLKGRSFQKKRNHLNRFLQAHPDYRVEPMTKENLPIAMDLVSRWREGDACCNPDSEFYLECKALRRAFAHFDELEMEGLILLEGEEALAMTMGSRLSPDTYDIHFEKALDMPESAYPAINMEFARYLRDKHPDVRFLNREDDLGVPGLRKAKLSYNPVRLIEKYWAVLREADDED